MKNYKLVSAILGGQWLIEPNWAKNNVAIIEAILKGESVQAGRYSDPEAANDDEIKRLALEPAVIGAGTFKASRWSSFKDAPEGSIALIPLTGPVLKYGDGCGGLGSVHLTQLVQEADKSANISAIIIKIDTPGGMVDGTATLADAIKAAKKPTIGFIDDGMMASAGKWIGSACDEIYASQPTDTIGSIGVYTTLVDYAGYYEKQGIRLLEIYSDRSKDKNKDYRDALAGDPSGIKMDLNLVADQFIKTVKANRKGKLNLDYDNPFTGKMYPAEEAIKVGLIDGIKSFDQVVARASELAQSPNSHKNSNQSAMNLTSKWNGLMALLGFTALTIGAQEHVNEANLQALGEETKKLQEGNAALASQVAKLNEDLTVANAAKTEAEASLKKAQEDLAASVNEVAGLKAQLPGAGPTNPGKKGEDTTDLADAVVDKDASHNKLAYEFLGR